jgi:hypothetical protein
MKALETQSRAEEARLVRTGLRKHVGLHRYYTSVKVRGDENQCVCVWWDGSGVLRRRLEP